MKFVTILYELLKKLLIKAIDAYQVFLSPYLGNNCKYHPSCSAYTKEALVKKGILIGLLLSTWRILRCNPLSKGGYDPVK